MLCVSLFNYSMFWETSSFCTSRCLTLFNQSITWSIIANNDQVMSPACLELIDRRINREDFYEEVRRHWLFFQWQMIRFFWRWWNVTLAVQLKVNSAKYDVFMSEGVEKRVLQFTWMWTKSKVPPREEGSLTCSHPVFACSKGRTVGSLVQPKHWLCVFRTMPGCF